jgi:hypothetical protein
MEQTNLPNLDTIQKLFFFEREEPPGQKGRFRFDVVDGQVNVDSTDLQNRRRIRRHCHFRCSGAQYFTRDDLKICSFLNSIDITKLKT